MPGFSEMSNHFSDFNQTISNKEVYKRKLRDRAFRYLNGLGLSFIKYNIRGHIMTFNYKCLGDDKTIYFRRSVNLENYNFKDEKIRWSNTKIVRSMSDGKFYRQ